MNILGILSALVPGLYNVIDQAVEDKDLATKLKHDISVQMLNNQSDMARASADVIMAEASGESWLQRNWRPMLMVWFAFLIGAYWFGFVPNNMPTEIVDELFTLVQIGVGGYVVGRSVEKTAKTVGPMLADRR